MKHFQHPARTAFTEYQHRLHQTSPLSPFSLAAAAGDLLVTGAPSNFTTCTRSPARGPEWVSWILSLHARLPPASQIIYILKLPLNLLLPWPPPAPRAGHKPQPTIFVPLLVFPVCECVCVCVIPMDARRAPNSPRRSPPPVGLFLQRHQTEREKMASADFAEMIFFEQPRAKSKVRQLGIDRARAREREREEAPAPPAFSFVEAERERGRRPAGARGARSSAEVFALGIPHPPWRRSRSSRTSRPGARSSLAREGRKARRTPRRARAAQGLSWSVAFAVPTFATTPPLPPATRP